MHQNLKLVSRAKINLTLEVLFKRSDGYHEIRSVIQEISLCDFITLNPITSSNRIELVCHHEDIPRDETNLAVRAAALLQRKFALRRGVLIELVKNIPIAAGLGGGSSNAAAVLNGINRLWELNLEAPELVQLAAQLGSDVPFFIQGGTALAQGRGEKLTLLTPFPNCHLLLAAPAGAELSAGEVYSNLTLDKIPNKTIAGQFILELDRAGHLGRDWLKRLQTLMTNQLEDAVFSLNPGVKTLKKKLREAGLTALVSGSGPTVFAVSEEEGILRQTSDKLRGEGYTVIMTGIPASKNL